MLTTRMSGAGVNHTTRAVPSDSRGYWRANWRRGRDSNPRNPCGFNGFRDRPIQPLSHLSAGVITRVTALAQVHGAVLATDPATDWPLVAALPDRLQPL